MVTQEFNCIAYIFFRNVETVHPIDKTWFNHANGIFINAFGFHRFHKLFCGKINHTTVFMTDDDYIFDAHAICRYKQALNDVINRLRYAVAGRLNGDDLAAIKS